MRRVYGFLIGALVVLPGTVGACGTSCTAIGAPPSAVQVVLPDLTDWRLERFCVGGTCSTDGMVEVADEAATYPFEISVTGPNGPIQAQGVVRTTKWWVNGEGCEPVRSSGRIDVRADGSIVASAGEA